LLLWRLIYSGILSLRNVYVNELLTVEVAKFMRRNAPLSLVLPSSNTDTPCWCSPPAPRRGVNDWFGAQIRTPRRQPSQSWRSV